MGVCWNLLNFIVTGCFVNTNYFSTFLLLLQCTVQFRPINVKTFFYTIDKMIYFFYHRKVYSSVYSSTDNNHNEARNAMTVIQKIKGSKERYLLGQNTTCKISG